MSDDLQRAPAEILHRDGSATPAQIVFPAWTPAELEDITRGLVERHWLTPEQGEREIRQIREYAARQQNQQRPEPRKRSGRTR